MKLRALCVLAFFCLATACFAQVPVQLAPVARQQFSDGSGNPLAGGFVFTYACGTTTPQATYTDSSGLFANTNPIVLDSGGEAVIWLSELGCYKFVVFNSSSVQQWSVDNITSIFSSANTWIQPQTFNAAANLLAGGALAGTFTGNPTFSGSPTFLAPVTFSGGANLIGSSAITAYNLNNIVFVDGTHFGTCNTALASLGSSPGVVIIPSTYVGADCTTTNAGGYNVVVPPANQQVWDLRGPSVATVYPISFNTGAFGGLGAFSADYYYNGSTQTASGILGTAQLTGPLAAIGNVQGVSGELEVVGTITGTAPSTVIGVLGEANVWSLGGTIPDIAGVSADVNLGRTTATTNITRAYAFRAGPCSNSSSAGATITDCYGLYTVHSTAGTAQNYALFANDKIALAYNVSDSGIDLQDTGGTFHNVLTDDGTDTLVVKPLSDSKGTTFSTTAGVPILALGGSTGFQKFLHGSGVALNSAFTAITAPACQEQTLTLTGAATTGVASVSPALTIGLNFDWQAWVSGTNTVTVRVCAFVSGTPTSVGWNVMVTQ